MLPPPLRIPSTLVFFAIIDVVVVIAIVVVIVVVFVFVVVVVVGVVNHDSCS